MQVMWPHRSACGGARESSDASPHNARAAAGGGAGGEAGRSVPRVWLNLNLSISEKNSGYATSCFSARLADCAKSTLAAAVLLSQNCRHCSPHFPESKCDWAMHGSSAHCYHRWQPSLYRTGHTQRIYDRCSALILFSNGSF